MAAHSLIPSALPVPLQTPTALPGGITPGTSVEGPTSVPSPGTEHLPGQKGQEQAEKGPQDDADDDGH